MSHRHEFSALPAVLGPYGPQNIHYHPCYAGCWEGPLPEDHCARVLVGAGRECDGKRETHRIETLGEMSEVVRSGRWGAAPTAPAQQSTVGAAPSDAAAPTETTPANQKGRDG